MNSVIPFDFEDHPVRVVDQENSPWFVAKDICDVLGISKYRDAIDRLDDDERVSTKVDTLGGKQDMIVINESGFYALTFRSRKEQARRFRKWVTSEVLPALRRHGRYGVASEETAPPMPLSPAHRADCVTAAARTFNGLLRAARGMGMAKTRAVMASNDATFRATGVDLVQELNAEDLAALPRPDDDLLALDVWLATAGDQISTLECWTEGLGRSPDGFTHSAGYRLSRHLQERGWFRVRPVLDGKQVVRYQRRRFN